MSLPSPVVTFLHPSRRPVLLGELDPSFLQQAAIGPATWERPLRVELEPRFSKRGNTFYDYDQVLPLPDQLDTVVVVDGVALDADEIGVSHRGNPTRRHAARVVVDGRTYEVTGYVTVGKSGCWVKVHAHLAAADRAHRQPHVPKGGRLV